MSSPVIRHVPVFTKLSFSLFGFKIGATNTATFFGETTDLPEHGLSLDLKNMEDTKFTMINPRTKKSKTYEAITPYRAYMLSLVDKTAYRNIWNWVYVALVSVKVFAFRAVRPKSPISC